MTTSIIKTKRLTLRFAPLLFLLAVILQSVQLGAGTLGMVADDATHSVIVFNADTDTVIASFPVPAGPAIGDCSITPDQAFGFVTSFTSVVTVVDLNNLVILPGIPIANPGEDTAITPDGRCLVVCGGSTSRPVSSIDVNLLAQVDTTSLPSDCNSVDVCGDGTILATSFFNGRINRLSIDEACRLTNTNDSINARGGVRTFSSPNNVTCAPGSESLIAVGTGFPPEIRSFTTPPLAGPVSVQNLTPGIFPGGLSAVVLFNSSSTTAFDAVVYARTSNAVDAFNYNATTGAIGGALAGYPIASSPRPSFFGMDQLGAHPNGSKLYVSTPGSLDVYDAKTGAFLRSIFDPAISSPTGICFASVLQVQIDLQPGGSPNCGNREKSRGKVPVAIFGSDTLDVALIDQSTLEFGGARVLRCAVEDAKMEGPTGVFTRDGVEDLVCHFPSQDVDWLPAGVDCGPIDLVGALTDGRPILGTDTACVAGGATCGAGARIR